MAFSLIFPLLSIWIQPLRYCVVTCSFVDPISFEPDLTFKIFLESILKQSKKTNLKGLHYDYPNSERMYVYVIKLLRHDLFYGSDQPVWDPDPCTISPKSSVFENTWIAYISPWEQVSSSLHNPWSKNPVSVGDPWHFGADPDPRILSYV